MEFKRGLEFLWILLMNFNFNTGIEALSRQKRVIGGNTVNQGETPWLVSLKGRIVTKRLLGLIPIEHRTVYCGGSVLSDRWILTAAHCFDGGRNARDVDAWEVRLAKVNHEEVELPDRFMDLLGKIFKKKEWRMWHIDVDRIIIHPNYDRSDFWNNDIALVRLEDSVPSGREFEHIKRIRLSEEGNSSFPSAGQICKMTGWGCTTAGGPMSGSAMAIDLPVLENQVCSSSYGDVAMSARLCAGFEFSSDDYEGGICPGDSGGPLVCQNEFNQWIQVGVASFTSRHNPERFPAVFARVSEFIDWIKFYVYY